MEDEILKDKKDLDLKDLGQFYGTEKYHKIPLFNEFNLTDGVIYIMSNGYSWFITDCLAVLKFKFKDQPFKSVKLKLLDDQKAKMIITDGNKKILYTQKYEYTTAKKELNLYLTDNVLMLSNEY